MNNERNELELEVINSELDQVASLFKEGFITAQEAETARQLSTTTCHEVPEQKPYDLKQLLVDTPTQIEPSEQLPVEVSKPQRSFDGAEPFKKIEHFLNQYDQFPFSPTDINIINQLKINGIGKSITKDELAKLLHPKDDRLKAIKKVNSELKDLLPKLHLLGVALSSGFAQGGNNPNVLGLGIKGENLNTGYKNTKRPRSRDLENVYTPPQAALSEGHKHRWRIEEANGPKSVGECSCGEKKEFKNWLEENDFVTNTEYRLGVATF